MATITFEGELDLASAPRAERELRAACDKAVLVVLELYALSFMDCAGLRAVLAADRRQREADGRLLIIHTAPQVRRLIELTGANQRLQLAWDTGTRSRRGLDSRADRAAGSS